MGHPAWEDYALGNALQQRPRGTVQNPNICVPPALPVFFSVYRKCRGSLVDWQLPPVRFHLDKYTVSYLIPTSAKALATASGTQNLHGMMQRYVIRRCHPAAAAGYAEVDVLQPISCLGFAAVGSDDQRGDFGIDVRPGRFRFIGPPIVLGNVFAGAGRRVFFVDLVRVRTFTAELPQRHEVGGFGVRGRCDVVNGTDGSGDKAADRIRVQATQAGVVDDSIALVQMIRPGRIVRGGFLCDQRIGKVRTAAADRRQAVSKRVHAPRHVLADMIRTAVDICSGRRALKLLVDGVVGGRAAGIAPVSAADRLRSHCQIPETGLSRSRYAFQVVLRFAAGTSRVGIGGGRDRDDRFLQIELEALKNVFDVTALGIVTEGAGQDIFFAKTQLAGQVRN